MIWTVRLADLSGGHPYKYDSKHLLPQRVLSARHNAIPRRRCKKQRPWGKPSASRYIKLSVRSLYTLLSRLNQSSGLKRKFMKQLSRKYEYKFAYRKEKIIKEQSSMRTFTSFTSFSTEMVNKAINRGRLI